MGGWRIIGIMNKVVKRGIGAYKVFLKNKIASSVLMFVSGVMMFIGAVNGHGNDTKSLPILITSIGVVLSLYAVFRLGYLKAHYDAGKNVNNEQRSAEFKMLLMQVGEMLVYVVVAGVGVFLLSNEGFTDKALNLMTGGFTTLNGVLGAINAFKERDDIDFRWKLLATLTVVELILGPFFIFASDSIGIVWYIVMGAVTTVAGLIEVISALTHENIESTINDGKKIVNIIMNDKEE